MPDRRLDHAGLTETPPAGVSHLERLRHVWNGSLRFRLLALGLMPLLIAFPIVIAVLVVIGGERTENLLQSNLRGNLAGARNYLDQVRSDAGVRVVQLVRSERLIQLLRRKADRHEFDEVLSTAARSSGLDFLIIADAGRRVIASSTGVAPGARLPDSYVVRQAQLGVANAAYERFEADQLVAFSPLFQADARVALSQRPDGSAGMSTRGLMINAAAHFPLAVDDTDAILIGGILLNNNFALIEHMREIIFPVGVLPESAEGITAVLIDDYSIAISRQGRQGQRVVGTRVPAEVSAAVMDRGAPWLGRLELSGESHVAGYEPILDGDGRRIGMIGAAFPAGPYQRAVLLVLGMITGLLALAMLAISLVFLRTGRELTQRLARIDAAMTRVRQGDREARAGSPLREDELGQLTRHFDVLLDTIAMQDAIRVRDQQAIADEASRRRALFEHERDGVLILNMDGSVFEANPKCAAMLGYSSEELAGLRPSDWDAGFTPAQIDALVASVGPEGHFFETTHRRKDGSTYAAEVAVSRAQWGDKTFWLVLHRDITERKAVERELEKYRRELEQLVEQRTRELNSRSEQLDAIFLLSPDGFVSFDAGLRVSFANRAFLRMTGFVSNDILHLDEVRFSELLALKCLPGAAFPGVAALRAKRRRIVAGDTLNEPIAARRQLIELVGPGNRVLEVGIRLAEAENVSQILYFRDVTHETEVDRMKSEFLSTAAHELRTPMTSIYGFSELLLSQEFDEATRKDLLATIFRNAELMSSIINELLDLARIEARRGKDFVVEHLSLQEIVAEAVAGYKLPPGREPPAVTQPQSELSVRGDRKKMQQAVLNIVSNAYKYSPRGGTVEISTRQDGSRVGIEVRDHGIGMTPEQLARVCERFYRADTSGNIPGTGLGMSITKEIIELHGGELELESERGAGTTVRFWLAAA